MKDTILYNNYNCPVLNYVIMYHHVIAYLV